LGWDETELGVDGNRTFRLQKHIAEMTADAKSLFSLEFAFFSPSMIAVCVDTL
jgi:hypothetical protein